MHRVHLVHLVHRTHLVHRVFWHVTYMAVGILAGKMAAWKTTIFISPAGAGRPSAGTGRDQRGASSGVLLSSEGFDALSSPKGTG
jgi:hypothetical protein